jgi:peptidyl-prolyl cis-trans isomerase SurA
MKLKNTVLIAALACLLPAFGQQPQHQYIVDKVVAVVGGLPILYSDVIQQAQATAEQNRANNYTSPREPLAEALEKQMEQKLLFQRAQIDSIGLEGLAPNIANAVDGSVEEMIAAAGSIKALEDEKNKPLYTIKEEMRSVMEEFYGSEEMRSWVVAPERVKITPGEVDRFYRRMDSDSLPIIPEQYVYAQITRLPQSVELAKQRTRESMLDLRQRIIDGERFDRLAMMYSVDPGSAMRGGEYDPAPKETWVGPFSDAVVKLQPGQTSGVVETEYGFHIIQLMDKPGDNLYHVRHILMKPSYTDDELQETVKYLDSLAVIIKNGDLTFAEAATRYSDDKDSKMNGGIVSNQQMLARYGQTDPRMTRTRFVRDELDPYDAQQLIRLSEGEISAAFVGNTSNMDQTGKILKLVEIIPAHKANL